MKAAGWLVVLAGGGLSLSACSTEGFCFDGCGEPPLTNDAGVGGSSGSSQGGSGGAFILPGDGGGDATTCNANLQTDEENCGSCGNICQVPGAFPRCEAGQCVVDTCAPGFYDIDGDPTNGCEYECAVPVPGPEVCDGLDNDCDGSTDLEDSDLMPPTGLCNSTAGTPCETSQVVCSGAEGWACSYSADVETDGGFVRVIENKCDGLDGNCDGNVDETYPDVGLPCDDGGIGVCRDLGMIACDPSDDTVTLCDLSLPPDPLPAAAEACNGLDDNCNGMIDEGIVFDMAPFPDATSPQFFVDRYEASRADATDQNTGLNELIACTRTGVLPWTAASHAQARTACESRGTGYRLCSAAELSQICGTGGAFPYGNAYEAATCNGYDLDVTPGAPHDNLAVPTGSLAQCKTAADVFDLSGNAAEWTSTSTGQTNEMPPQEIYQLHGGSFLSPALGLSCDIDLAPRAGERTVLDNIGFRCCLDP